MKIVLVFALVFTTLFVLSTVDARPPRPDGRGQEQSRGRYQGGRKDHPCICPPPSPRPPCNKTTNEPPTTETPLSTCPPCPTTTASNTVSSMSCFLLFIIQLRSLLTK